METFISDIKKYIIDGKNIYIIVDKKEKSDKIKKVLEEYEITALNQESFEKIISRQDNKTVYVSVGKISNGFFCNDLNQVLIEASDMVEVQRRAKKRKSETFNQG